METNIHKCTVSKAGGWWFVKCPTCNGDPKRFGTFKAMEWRWAINTALRHNNQEDIFSSLEKV